MSRDISKLHPDIFEKYHAFEKKMWEAGINFIVTCTSRTKEEQEELYAQGRTKPGKIVTRTLKSKHLEGKAFDICILRNGKASWDEEDYLYPGELGKEIGLKWGGDWPKPDYPHFEV